LLAHSLPLAQPQQRHPVECFLRELFDQRLAVNRFRVRDVRRRPPLLKVVRDRRRPGVALKSGPNLLHIDRLRSPGPPWTSRGERLPVHADQPLFKLIQGSDVAQSLGLLAFALGSPLKSLELARIGGQARLAGTVRATPARRTSADARVGAERSDAAGDPDAAGADVGPGDAWTYASAQPAAGGADANAREYAHSEAHVTQLLTSGFTADAVSVGIEIASR
jgi:hypothetical protein